MAFREVKLPELDPLDTIWMPEQLHHAPYMGLDHFSRPVKINPKITLPIETVLKVADKGFSLLAKKCGARVVGHTWGMIPYSDEYIGTLPSWATYRTEELPDGFILGARVETIIPIEPVDNNAVRRLEDGVKSYNSSWSRLINWGRPNIDETADTYQFTYGTTLASRDPSMILHDIEPYLT